MHAVLASEPDDPAFAPEEASPESLALLTATVDDEIDEVFLDAARGRVDGADRRPGRRRARRCCASVSTVGSVGRRIRHHGDLHLGQVLWSTATGS